MNDRRVVPEFKVGEWVASPTSNELCRGHRTVKVTPKVMDLLCVLAENAPSTVTREELLRTVWVGRHVGDESLTHAVSDLRKALGDDTRRPRFVQTIPKRGYRLVAAPMPIGESRRSRSVPSAVVLLGAAVTLVVVSALAAWLLLAREPPEGEGRQTFPIPVTSLPGSEWQPSLSPDGERLAFEWREHIYMIELGSTMPVALTQGPGMDGGPAWSDDGTSIAFSRLLDGECSIQVLNVAEGDVRLVGKCDPQSSPDISWHPSGSWLAISDSVGSDGRSQIRILSHETGHQRSLFLTPDGPPSSSDVYPTFSLDGRRLAYAQTRLGRASIRVVDVGDPVPVARGEPETLMTVEAEIRGLDWAADGRTIVLATGRAEEGSLWRVDSQTGRAEPIDLGSRRISQPTLARRAERLVFVEQQIEMNLWEALLNGQEPPTRQPLVVSTRADFNPQFSPDGQRIAFASNRSGSMQIWTSSSDGSQPEPITQGEWDLATTPAWSPDGKRIAFAARKDGRFRVWGVAASGGPAEILVGEPPGVEIDARSSNSGDPAYSPDGRWLYFISDRSGRFEIWRIELDGTVAEQVTRSGGLAPHPGAQGR